MVNSTSFPSGGSPSVNVSNPTSPPSSPATLLRIENLKMHFPILRGLILQRQVGSVKAVDGVSFEVRRGETLGLVGESGCGKSTTGRAILQLYRPTAGHVYFEGTDLTQLHKEELRRMRRRMQMVFQDPYASLNPRQTVGAIIGEPLTVFNVAKGKAQQDRVKELLDVVGLNPSFINRYPHEFSGGQRQRIVIARALALNPDFIVCDEPISALDVSIQAQVVNLLEALQEQFGLTYLFIAHDLSVVRHISDRVAVMYLGKVVELADRDTIYQNPLHPYTQALLSAVPIPDPEVEAKRQRIILKGDVPSPVNPPKGCHFHTRCPWVTEACRQDPPPEFRDVGGGHFVACHLVK
ncbi:ABC transporter ATP-binding protein [Thermostichus vulcanus]|uniref:Dipeptide ABC transporter ATP-binding protein n=1 Tax=Thermostichus vulcanus str. 'Rupite' TaxID=2813851 RepID=A0ABT0C9M9_THEVL|nr:dipeptide ABC transporter ATP-binding protein [Thermostichus vulcanus]MCJ2542495.1 dipeptide ABC transporter ATP-binding protein [Thermostichus vulcanus str. 'Rupite']